MWSTLPFFRPRRGKRWLLTLWIFSMEKGKLTCTFVVAVHFWLVAGWQFSRKRSRRRKTTAKSDVNKSTAHVPTDKRRERTEITTTTSRVWLRGDDHYLLWSVWALSVDSVVLQAWLLFFVNSHALTSRNCTTTVKVQAIFPFSLLKIYETKSQGSLRHARKNGKVLHTAGKISHYFCIL